MLVFPVRLFNPASLRVSLVGGAMTGGVSLGGGAQVSALSGGGLWSIEFGETSLWARERMLAWRAMEAALDSGATPIIVPLGDRRHQPTNAALTTTPFSDETLWDDATAWDQSEAEAALTADAALRATEVSFSFAAARPLLGGEHFSILHGSNKGWRLYRLIQKVSEADGVQTWKIRPPLRAAAATDTPLNFDSPRCVCRVNGDVGALLEMLRFGKGQAAFVEAFPESLG